MGPKKRKASPPARPIQGGISFKNLERTLNSGPAAQMSFLKNPVETLKRAGVVLDTEEGESVKSQISSMRQLLKMWR